METCDTCNGTGAKPGTVAENCKHCNGTGQERILQQTVFGTVTQVRTCRVCNGQGKIIKEKCPTCFGKGKVRRNKSLNITIPKGIDNGQSIVLQGKGDPGEKGGPNGDMVITVTVMPHKLFTRRESNLYLEIPISFVQATLGGDITIPTMASEEKYTIKAGTQTGTVFSMRGKGMPNVRNEKIVGDLIVTLKVSVPTSITDKQRSALLAFSEEMGDDYNYSKKGFFDKFLGK
jgi:molecular chaperone DnaJ